MFLLTSAFDYQVEVFKSGLIIPCDGNLVGFVPVKLLSPTAEVILRNDAIDFTRFASYCENYGVILLFESVFVVVTNFLNVRTLLKPRQVICAES